MESKIEAIISADSLSPQGKRLTSVLATFPRIILAEVNTHRMLSKNTSSSRAIPFNKMVEAVQNNPFIPIAWQKEHKGMQGNDYLSGEFAEGAKFSWECSIEKAIEQAIALNSHDVTKQLCNRILEPFMWTTMLITGSKEGWDNFFELRCPQYYFKYTQGKEKWDNYSVDNTYWKSKKDWIKFKDSLHKEADCYKDSPTPVNNLDWLQLNKGQAEIHMMALSEKIYDAIQESKPKVLKDGGWHIPMIEVIED